jgi:hypothetical protein
VEGGSGRVEGGGGGVEGVVRVEQVVGMARVPRTEICFILWPTGTAG